jgi:hypothetical protein
MLPLSSIRYHAQDIDFAQGSSGNEDPQVVGIEIRGGDQKSLRAELHEVAREKPFQNLVVLESHLNPKARHAGAAQEEFTF